MSQVLDPSPVERAQDALHRHAWSEAYELLADADGQGELDAQGLLLLGQAAWWVGRLPDAVEARERAYAHAMRASDPATAATAALMAGRDHVIRNANSMATAWFARAQRVIEQLPESPLNGWLAAMRAFHAGLIGPIETTLASADTAERIAAQFGDRNLAAMAMVCRGVGLATTGHVADGMALLEEAAVGAVAGELEPDIAGSVCCAAIGMCAAIGETERAIQWTEAQDRWCEREGISGYPGMCRLYRAEVKSSRGAWLEAEAEARRASEELRGFVPGAVGAALYTIGEIRLRRGDLEAAEEALLKAHELGRVEPALSLLRLEQGRTEAASESIARALDGSSSVLSWSSTPNSPLTRALMLPAQVEIALAAGDVALARRAADELTSLAETFDVTPILARALTEAGAVSVAEGDPGAGVAKLRDATAKWQRIEAPWDAARARRLLGEALAADGAPESAVLELRAAGRAFEELAAAPELRRVAAALARLGVDAGVDVADVRRRVLRTFIFTDIVDSTRLASTVGDEAWDRALRWHDHMIRTIVSEHGGEEIKRTGDGFFLAFDDPDEALEAARAIQRGLATPPADLGAPLAVRIGAHRAEANRSGMDYLGSGVNLAARLTAAAHGGEILASHQAVDGARRRYEVRSARSIELRGIPEPVEVATIGWN